MEYPGGFQRVGSTVALVAVGYGVVNFFALWPGPAPGLAALAAWVFVLPTFMAGLHWAVLPLYRTWSDAWWMVALAATLFYAFAGLLSYGMIWSIWAAV
jgi:hypothetical protein